MLNERNSENGPQPGTQELNASKASQIAHRTVFNVLLSVGFGIEKPAITAVSHHFYSGRTTFLGYGALRLYYHITKTWFCFKGESVSGEFKTGTGPWSVFKALVLQILPTPTVASQWHVNVLGVLDECCIHKSHSTYTATRAQTWCIYRGLFATKQYKP